MDKKNILISDEQIDSVWGNSNFGSMSKREVIDSTILKCASGYSTGYTAKCIAEELGLIKTGKWELTNLGKKYLYEAFVKDRSF